MPSLRKISALEKITDLFTSVEIVFLVNRQTEGFEKSITQTKTKFTRTFMRSLTTQKTQKIMSFNEKTTNVTFHFQILVIYPSELQVYKSKLFNTISDTFNIRLTWNRLKSQNSLDCRALDGLLW